MTRSPTLAGPRAAGAAALLLAPLCAAADPASGGTPLSAGQVLNVLLGLVAVLAAIGVLAWVSRHVFRLQADGTGAIRIVGSLALGPRERVMLLQVGGVQLLVGVSPGRLQTLHVLEESDAVAVPAPGAREGFAGQLARLAGRNAGDRRSA
jgi:flagellar protein FliO/FliZ